jgi:hypothetical protein
MSENTQGAQAPDTETSTPAPRMSAVAQDAIKKILALRALTKATGNITTRAQNSILRTLGDAALAEVALYLPADESQQ